MKCPKCSGKQLIMENSSSDDKLRTSCDFCYGKKELDWIEFVFGITFAERLIELNLMDKYEVSEM